uniref:Uncharacterized protein n=1 Tax=Glossina palpalis gambiensis TaxID=67801 RepID=A0A1B0BU73_9MUSC
MATATSSNEASSAMQMLTDEYQRLQNAIPRPLSEMQLFVLRHIQAQYENLQNKRLQEEREHLAESEAWKEECNHMREILQDAYRLLQEKENLSKLQKKYDDLFRENDILLKEKREQENTSKEEIDSLLTENETLKAERRELKENICHLNTDLDILRSDAGSLENREFRYQRQIEKLDGDNKSLLEKITHLQQRMREEDENNEKLKRDNEQLHQASNEKDEWRKEVDNLNEKYCSLRAHCTAVEGVRSKLQEQINSLKTQNQILSDERNNLKSLSHQRKIDCEEQLKQLRASSSEQKENFEQRLNSIQNEKLFAEQRLHKLIAEKEQQLSRLQAALDKLSSENSSNKERLSTLIQQHSILENESKNIREHNNYLMGTLKTLTEENASLQSQGRHNVQLENKIQSKDREIKNLKENFEKAEDLKQQQMHELEERHKQLLKSQLDENKEKFDKQFCQLSAEYFLLRGNCKKLEEEKDKREEEVLSLSNENEELNDKNSSLEEKLRQEACLKEQQSSMLEERLRQLQAKYSVEIDYLKNQINSLQQEKFAGERVFNEKEQLVKQLQDAHYQLTQQINVLTEQLNSLRENDLKLLQGEREHQLKKITDLCSTISEKEKVITALCAHNENIQLEKSNLKEQLENSAKEVEMISGSKAKLQEMYDALNSKLHMLLDKAGRCTRTLQSTLNHKEQTLDNQLRQFNRLHQEFENDKSFLMEESRKKNLEIIKLQKEKENLEEIIKEIKERERKLLDMQSKNLGANRRSERICGYDIRRWHSYIKHDKGTMTTECAEVEVQTILPTSQSQNNAINVKLKNYLPKSKSFILQKPSTEDHTKCQRDLSRCKLNFSNAELQSEEDLLDSHTGSEDTENLVQSFEEKESSARELYDISLSILQANRMRSLKRKLKFTEAKYQIAKTWIEFKRGEIQKSDRDEL